MRRLAKELKTPWTLKGNPTVDEYAALLAWANELLAELQSRGAEDMVDIQSLLWVAGEELGKEQAKEQSGQSAEVAQATIRCWKIAPGEGAWIWQTWQEQGYISVGWDALGDLSQVAAQDWPALRDEVISQHDDYTTTGADQAWRFATEIKPGDLLLVNDGKRRILGFGSVTGQYYYQPNERHGHRIPVEWLDTQPRDLPAPEGGWRRTLVPLSEDEFEAFRALPPAPLAPPFSAIFADRAEATEAFQLMADALGALGVKANDDPRFSVTVVDGRHIALNFGPWRILRWGPVTSERRVQLLLPEDAPETAQFQIGGPFVTKAQGRSFVLGVLAPAELSTDVRTRFLEAARCAGLEFGHHKASSYRLHHHSDVGAALFDAAQLNALLTKGAKPVEPAFDPQAEQLLVAFTANPTRVFYAEHNDELTRHVQEPVQDILMAVAERIAEPLKEALETEKRLFGVFPKNDYGRGGAWPFYWGAFYPKGGKRSEGCQLYVTLDETGFSYGFSIGNYAGDDRKRFARNAVDNSVALLAALSPTLNTPDFAFGDENVSIGGGLVEKPEGLDLTGWLTQADKVGPHAKVALTWEQLRDIERAQLVDDVTDALNRLFPLVLLGTLDDPLPAIRTYLEGEEVDEEEVELNEAFSLDDLAAETSLPKETLESWLRAIERKGQAILYGPPGTGKTYVAERLAKHLIAEGTGIFQLVQFHPAYAYEDFMQGMRPRAREGGGLDYPVIDGRFKQFCQEARGKGVSALIIDEVNRANLARVFGELMYLLEYRDKSIPLASGGQFSIPANVRIIGTMNTADRSIALVDHALRRRFAFLPLYPDYQMLRDFHAGRGTGFDPEPLIKILGELNRKINDRHYEVGTSFFLRTDLAEQLADVWRMEIEPYLEEYFFDQQGVVDSFRWDEVKKRLGEA